MARCGYVRDKGVRFFLPECMGGAVYGMNGCTCSSREPKSLDARISKLERDVATLKNAPHPRYKETASELIRKH